MEAVSHLKETLRTINQKEADLMNRWRKDFDEKKYTNIENSIRSNQIMAAADNDRHNNGWHTDFELTVTAWAIGGYPEVNGWEIRNVIGIYDGRKAYVHTSGLVVKEYRKGDRLTYKTLGKVKVNL